MLSRLIGEVYVLENEILFGWRKGSFYIILSLPKLRRKSMDYSVRNV